MRKVLNEIEKLDGQHPGLLIAVRNLLDHGETSVHIQGVLQREYGVPVTRSMVENYRCRRWVPHKEKIQEESQALEAAYHAVGGNRGLDLIAFARSRELINKSDLKETVAVRLALVKIREQELKEAEFNFKTHQLKAQKEAGEGEDAGDAAAAKTARVVRKIKEIFGISPDAEEMQCEDAEGADEPDIGDASA